MLLWLIHKVEEIPLIEATFEKLFDVQFNNQDCNKFLVNNNLDNRGNKKESQNSFIYCDPPYLGTSDNYSNSFTEEQSISLFDTLEKTKCKFAVSEFDNPFILDQAKQRKLNVIVIGERCNLKNRRTEILVTNYQNNPTLFNFKSALLSH